VNLDDEWPEEDVKPKKGKKGKKGKKVQQDEDEDDWFVKPEEKQEVKEEAKEEVKGEPKAAATPPVEAADAAEEEDEGPKVSHAIFADSTRLTPDPDQGAEGEAQEGEGEGAQGGA